MTRNIFITFRAIFNLQQTDTGMSYASKSLKKKLMMWRNNNTPPITFWSMLSETHIKEEVDYIAGLMNGK